MPKNLSRPDDQILQSYLLGTLPECDAQTVQEWVEATPAAAETLCGINATDPLTRTIAEPAPGISCPESVVETQLRTLSQHGVPSWMDDTELDIPATVGKHQIRGVIGRGGMGVVLEGWDDELSRKVAIKLIAPRYAADPAVRARFRREAGAVAALDHGNVVPVFEYGEEGGIPYFVMQYLAGETLEECLKREGTLPAAEVRRIFREVADGLAAAHARGVIHRDIKPSNIWLDKDTGRARLLDFGLAKPITETDTEKNLTSSGAVMGTVLYMSPEQAKAGQLDERSDLFSLGAVMYEAATGKRPFDGPTTAAVLLAVVAGDPLPPQAVNPTLPSRLSATIESLLEKNPDDRPASAAEVAKALARPDDPPPRSVLPWWVLAASVLLVCGATAAMYQLVFTTKDGTLVVELNDKETEVRFKNGELHIYGRDGKLQYTLKPGERNAKVAPGDYTVKVVGADGVELETKEFTMTKDGMVIVRVTAKELLGNLKPTLTLATTLPLPNLDAKDARTLSVAFSPDSTRLLAATGKTVVLWDVANRKKLWSFEAREAVNVVALSPDGTRAFSGGGFIPLQILDAKTGEKLRTLGSAPLDAEVVFDALFLPDNRQILVSHRDSSAGPSTIRLWDTETGKEVRSFPGHKSYATSLALSTDGKRFASSGHLEKVARLWDIEKKEAIRTFEEHTLKGNSVAITSDGERVASGSADGIVQLWQIKEKAGPQLLRGHDRDVGYLRFSSNGKQLYSSDAHKLILWSTETGEKLKVWDMPSYNGLFVLSRDDKLLAISNTDGTISIYLTSDRK